MVLSKVYCAAALNMNISFLLGNYGLVVATLAVYALFVFYNR